MLEEFLRLRKKCKGLAAFGEPLLLLPQNCIAVLAGLLCEPELEQLHISSELRKIRCGVALEFDYHEISDSMTTSPRTQQIMPFKILMSLIDFIAKENIK